jgi:hypothetical protein
MLAHKTEYGGRGGVMAAAKMGYGGRVGGGCQNGVLVTYDLVIGWACR